MLPTHEQGQSEFEQMAARVAANDSEHVTPGARGQEGASPLTRSTTHFTNLAIASRSGYPSACAKRHRERMLSRVNRFATPPASLNQITECRN
jgi:hypothetical protein